MPFVVRDDLTFEAKVRVRFPSPDRAGEAKSEHFTARFQALPVAEALEIGRRLAKAVDAERGSAEEEDASAELIRRVLVGWAEVVDEAGEPVPFSEAALDQLIRFSFVREAIMAAYNAALAGKPVPGYQRGN